MNMKIKDVAEELGKSQQFVRIRTTTRNITIWNSTSSKWRKIQLLHIGTKVL